MRVAKRIREARHGEVSVTGYSVAEANANLAAAVDHLCAHGANGPDIECRFGLILVLWADPEGWAYTIIDPVGATHGTRYRASCSFRAENKAEALCDVRFAAAQRAWTPSVDDDAHIAASGVTAFKAADLRSVMRHWRESAKAA